jgi:putative redox protein
MEANMAEAKVTWLQDRIFIGTDSTKHSVVLSSPGEKGGIGMKPSELLLVSLASCTAVDIVSIFEKRRTPLESLEIQVQAEQNEDPPWMFKNIHLSYHIKGNGITEEAAKKAIELSENKYCSVSASLKGEVNIGYDIKILKEEE